MYPHHADPDLLAPRGTPSRSGSASKARDGLMGEVGLGFPPEGSHETIPGSAHRRLRWTGHRHLRWAVESAGSWPHRGGARSS